MAIHYQKLFTKDVGLLNGNLQIIACAGSGKTDFISERVAFQLKEKVARPDEIVAFTFTEKAAEELKFRIRKKIKELIGKQPDICDMHIGTIHGFAFNLLKEFIPKYRSYDVLDEVSRLAFISSIRYDINIEHLKNSLLTRFTRPYNRNTENWAITRFIRDADIIREESLPVKVAVTSSFTDAFDIYLEKLEERKFLDFSSIMRIAADVLESDKTVLKNVQSRYKFFTVDEYQDVNPIQEKLIQLISGKKNVCVVGDDDQSIYQWRGADISNIMSFTKRYPKVRIHNLETNRRSHDKIILSAKEFIKLNSTRLKKNIQHTDLKNEPGDLYKIIFDKQEEEIEWIKKKIKSLIGKAFNDTGSERQIQYSDIAILFRSISNEAQPYIDVLSDPQDPVPLIYSGVGGLFDTVEVSGIIEIFEYICECDRDIDYSDQFLTNVLRQLIPIFSLKTKNVIREIKVLRDWARNQKRLSLQNLYLKLLSIVGMDKPDLHDPNDDVLLYNLGRLSQAISDFENSREYLTFRDIKSFIWFIRLHAENSYDSGNTNEKATLVNAVQIMTMHGTKGLGFPVIFMPSHFRREPFRDFGATFLDMKKVNLTRYLNQTDDERRLFYVAMTRAKKFLFLTTADYKIDGQRRSHHISLFDEVPDKYFITSPKPDPTKRKPCKKLGISSEIMFPTSYSELSYYLNCGYDYKLRFLHGFNPGIVPQLGFGRQIHNIINLLHNEFNATTRIPDKKKIDEVIDAHFYLRYASKQISDSLKIHARKSIEKYVKMWKTDFSLAIKTERPFELEFNNALISGSIDLLKRDSVDESILEVIDFKTGKPNSDLAEKYDLQIQLYTIAAREALGLNTKKALVHYLDDEKNQRVEVITSTYAMKNASEQIGFAIGGITTASFKRDARRNQVCKNCDFCDICPKRSGFKA